MGRSAIARALVVTKAACTWRRMAPSARRSRARGVSGHEMAARPGSWISALAVQAGGVAEEVIVVRSQPRFAVPRIPVPVGEVALERPHPGHLAKVGDRRDALGERHGVAAVDGVDQGFEVGAVFFVALVGFEAGSPAFPHVVAGLPLVEMLGRAFERSEALFEGDLVERLDVGVEPDVLPVEADVGVARARRRRPEGAEGEVGERLVRHRLVLDHVVERHLPQPEEGVGFFELQLEGGLAGDRPKGTPLPRR